MAAFSRIYGAGQGPINCNLTGKPAILDRLIQCYFCQAPRGTFWEAPAPLPQFGYATGVRKWFFRNNFIIFFIVGRKEYHFWNQWIILHNDTNEALAVSFNILFVDATLTYRSKRLGRGEEE